MEGHQFLFNAEYSKVKKLIYLLLIRDANKPFFDSDKKLFLKEHSCDNKK